MNNRWIVVSFTVLLMISVVSSACAQFGDVSGKIVDEVGKPVSGAYVSFWHKFQFNTSVSSYPFSAETDKFGRYLIPAVPTGIYTIGVHKTGFPTIQKHIFLVKASEETTADFVLKPEPTEPPDHDKVPWWRTDGETSDEFREYNSDPSDSNQVDGVLEAVAQKAGIVYPGVQKQKEYADHLPPVQSHGLEFRVQYDFDYTGESTVVTVRAKATNISSDPLSVCGVFSYLYFDRKTLVASRRSSSPTIECESRDLEPGESIADTFRFTYETEAASIYPSEYHLWSWFFNGENGIRWENSNGKQLGVLEIPKKVRPSN
jgi:hypothetical protein